MAVWVSVQPPFPYFTDTDGSALEDGYIWLGEANKNPQVNPLAVYLDDAFTQPVAQPIRTRSGYPAINGAIVRLYTQQNYSIQVNNKNGSLIYSAPTPTEVFGVIEESTNAAFVEYDPQGAGAVQTTVQTKLRETVSVKDFGAVGDGIANDSAAIQLALNSIPASGGKINFPKGTYLLKDIDIIDKEGISIDFGDSTINIAAGAQYAFKMENTSPLFKRGGIWENATFGTGSASVGLIWIDGGAWSNQVFNRINNDNASAPADFYYSNNTPALRNPSNFTFTQCFDRSFGCKYWFHYDAIAPTVNFDNFVMRNILFYGDQADGSVIYFDGAAALYSLFENIYGGMFANNVRLVKMAAGVSASRNTWRNLLMEGTGNNRICMDGYYNESSISTVVCYIDETTYTGNQVYSAVTTSCNLDHLILQNASTGAYSTNTAVTLLTNSNKNTIFETGVLNDLGYKNTVYRGQGDYLVSQTYEQIYTSDSAPVVLTLNYEDFEVNDVIKIFIAGTSSGALYKDLELLEASVRSLFSMPGGLIAEDWSIELTYQVMSVAGVKSLSPHLRVFKGTTCVINEFKTPVSFFPVTFQLVLSLTAASWAGSSIALRTAYAAPLYNQS